MVLGRSKAADSRTASVMVGSRRRRVLTRCAWTWWRSLGVLHCCRIKVLGFSGNWEIWVMVVTEFAGKQASADAIGVETGAWKILNLIIYE